VWALFTVAIGVRVTLLVLLLTAHLKPIMSSVKIGDNVWVKLANEKIWWPSSIVSVSDPRILEQSPSNDPFSGGGFNDLMVIKYICATSDSDDAKLAILKLSAEGDSWDCLDDFDRRSQNIPASLKAQYDSAISLIYNEKKDRGVKSRFDSISLVTPNKQNNPITNGIREFSAGHSELPSESDNSVRNRNVMTAATTEGYDLEGIINPINELFCQEIEPSSLQCLDHKCTTKSRVLKRENVVPWDDYFMSIAFLSAMRSKDPSTQVGACIVNPDRRIVGIGEFFSSIFSSVLLLSAVRCFFVLFCSVLFCFVSLYEC
jgi:Cytidine and deoxycytidylate deaminase zinc-binding region